MTSPPCLPATAPPGAAAGSAAETRPFSPGPAPRPVQPTWPVPGRGPDQHGPRLAGGDHRGRS
jgi:hypothetical protein